jgi:hypothetical protein
VLNCTIFFVYGSQGTGEILDASTQLAKGAEQMGKWSGDHWTKMNTLRKINIKNLECRIDKIEWIISEVRTKKWQIPILPIPPKIAEIKGQIRQDIAQIKKQW